MIVARKWPLALFLVIVTMFVFFNPSRLQQLLQKLGVPIHGLILEEQLILLH